MIVKYVKEINTLNMLFLLTYVYESPSFSEIRKKRHHYDTLCLQLCVRHGICVSIDCQSL